MDRLEPEERARGEYPACSFPSMTLDEWRLTGRPDDVALQLAADAEVREDLDALLGVACIVVEFPAFTDGRGFSQGRRLRQRGFSGDLLARGDLLPDQWPLLERCGFSGFVSEELEERGRARPRPRVAYQVDALNPRPAFRQR